MFRLKSKYKHGSKYDQQTNDPKSLLESPDESLSF